MFKLILIITTIIVYVYTERTIRMDKGKHKLFKGPYTHPNGYVGHVNTPYRRYSVDEIIDLLASDKSGEAEGRRHPGERSDQDDDSKWIE